MYNPLPIDGVLVISVGGNPGSAIGRRGKLLSHPIGLENIQNATMEFIGYFGAKFL